VIQANELPTPLVWSEHWPEETTQGQETFELLIFSSYEVVERAPYFRRDEGTDRGCDLEDSGPYSSGVVGR
jgi:hypothetical protein